MKPSELLRKLRRLARRRSWEINVSEGKRHTKAPRSPHADRPTFNGA